jgi:hypothetical protein
MKSVPTESLQEQRHTRSLNAECARRIKASQGTKTIRDVLQEIVSERIENECRMGSLSSDVTIL